MNAQLKEELKEGDLRSQAKDITVVCNSLQENFNEDLGERLKSSKSSEEEVALLKPQAVDQKSKLTEIANLLKESRAKCNKYGSLQFSKMKHKSNGDPRK